MIWHLWQSWSSSLLLILACYNLASAFQVTGVSAGVDSATGARPFRLEINEFAQSGAAFDLFILALQQLQKIDQSELLSYFQISGIHGFPHQPWDGVLGFQSGVGYCAHSCAIFPPWHRPFVALYEQVLWTNAQAIARSYPLSQREQYISAAITMRLPYWDWAANPELPVVVAIPTITVNSPNGSIQITNPLYRYVFLQNQTGNGFPDGNAIAPAPWTIRGWNGGLDYQSNESMSNAALMGQAPTILSMTYQMFTSITDYTEFSSQDKANPSSNFNSNNIESIHNSIHTSVGSSGHMAFTEVAAFDPIFFLHHANVDRLFAMWQAINPDQYLTPTVNHAGTYVEPVGYVDAGNTSLYPFHSTNGTAFHTSDGVRSLKIFGYSYPELVDWNVSAPDLQANVRRRVNELYNPSWNQRTSTNPVSPKLVVRNADVGSAFSHITVEMAKNMRVNNLSIQWSIHIQVQRLAHDSSFIIDFFMGIPPTDASQWATASNLIGSYAQFISFNVSRMYPHTIPTNMVRGEVSMTHTLAAGVARGLLDDTSPKSVVPLLRDNLQWRARSASGHEIDLASLGGLSISVTSRTLTPAAEACEFPTYGESKWHPDATKNKAGGTRQWHRLNREGRQAVSY